MSSTVPYERSRAHEFAVTRTTLSDGRELIYFDDEPDYVSGAKVRKLDDERDLPETIPSCELRRDPLTGEWNTYAAHRMNRTFMPAASENPLAPSKPGLVPTEVPADDYDVVVFENRFPSLSTHMQVPDDFATAVDGDELYPRRPALARCEVVCFSPNVNESFRDLSYERARTVVEAWAHRTRELSAIDGVRIVFPFENRGEEIGVTLQHPHGQIYSYPFVPPRAAAIIEQARAHRQRTGRDLFDDVLAAERRSGKRIIAEGEYFTAFVPAAAKWPVEVMLVPHRQVADFAELTDAEKSELTTMYLDLLRRMDKFFDGVERTPYIAAWNQAVLGEGREFGRLHLQLYSMMRSPGRMKFLAGSESGAGAWISDTTPERIAQRFREVSKPVWNYPRPAKSAAEDATELFHNAYGTAPEGVWAAPGRVNLIGEHVDYAGGICLPFALSYSTFAAVSPRRDSLCRIVSDMDAAAEPFTIDLSDVGPLTPSTWAGYGLGTIWAMIDQGTLPETTSGFDIAITSDVPVGAGLSSSAALECSIGLAAFELTTGHAPSDEQRAEIIAAAMRAENDVVGAATGGLDQAIAMRGAEKHALAIDFSDHADWLVPAGFADSELAVLVINTNVKHSLADGQYASRRGIIDAVTAGLGVGNLRELADPISAAATWAGDNVPEGSNRSEWIELVGRRVRHVVSEIERTSRAIEELNSADYTAFGKSMTESHASLRDDYEVSCPELDVAVATAFDNGALGARMTGGGFGGSAIALLRRDAVRSLTEEITAEFARRGFHEPEFLLANPAAGARRVG